MLQVTRSSDGAAKEHEHRVKGFEIFVGGLARSVTEGMIREVFSSCGEILEVRMIKDQNGTSKGFCFVRFATKEAAFKARKEKDGSMLEGKKLGVAQSANQDSLFLGNLRKDWSFEEFNKMVRQAFQDVVSTELAMPLKTGDSADGKRQNRGFGFVQFSSHGAAARAHRIGSKPDFVLGDKWHPIVDWAEKEPEIDPEELAKIKVAFVGNLPKNTDEGFLKKLFEPFGKLEKVALSRKGHFPVGFIHFAKRSELDNAIKEMDGKMVQGPEKGPNFEIQVSVARPAEKDRKRARDESQSKTANKSGTRATSSKEIYARDYSDNHKPKAPQFSYSREVPDAIDPYEKAVASLPSPLTERLLRIFRLGIATRYDIDIHLITSLKEIPLSAAILVLDQFMLTCADGYDKGRDLAGLIARHQINNVGLNRKPLHLPGRTRDFEPRESELPSLPGPKHVPAFDPVVSRSAGTALASVLVDNGLRIKSFQSRRILVHRTIHWAIRFNGLDHQLWDPCVQSREPDPQSMGAGTKVTHRHQDDTHIPHHLGMILCHIGLELEKWEKWGRSPLIERHLPWVMEAWDPSPAMALLLTVPQSVHR